MHDEPNNDKNLKKELLLSEISTSSKNTQSMSGFTFKNEEKGNLVRHGCPVREGNLVRRHPEVLGKRVEAPDLGEFDGEVGQQNVLCASPLLGRRYGFSFLQLILIEVRNVFDDDPWHAAPKVADFVQKEGHDACSEDRVADQSIYPYEGMGLGGQVRSACHPATRLIPPKISSFNSRILHIVKPNLRK